MHNLDREQKLELLRLLEEKARRSHLYRYRTYFDTRYEWHQEGHRGFLLYALSRHDGNS
jgi:hypothetical protein